MKLEPLDEIQIEGIVSKAIQDAVDFIDGEIAPQRVKAQRYFDGETDLGYEEGRSRVVATKCREAVRGIKPSIQRIFLTNEKPVEFVGRNEEDVRLAEQATQFISYKFQKHDGYRIFNDVMQDALVKKGGIAHVFYNEEMENEIITLRNLTDDGYASVTREDNVSIIAHSEETKATIDENGLEIEETRHDVKISRSTPHGDICIESIPPETFFVDRNARSMDDYYICGHSTDVTIADLLSMGFSLDDLAGIDGSNYSTADDEAEFERRGYATDESDDENASYSSKKITLTQAYMKLDVEGTGEPALYQFICAGVNYKLLNFYEADIAPYAIFECDPEPHAFFGTSLVDLLISDQDAATSMLRGVLDNVALTNNPGITYMDGQVNVSDLLNNEIGRLVRVKNPNAISEMSVPFTAGATLPALQYFDQLVDNKTGVSKMAQGLNPDVLATTTATAIAASTEAQTGQAEVIARNFAEGGMRRMFKLMLNLMVRNADADEMMRLNGEFVAVDPTKFDPDMDLIINVGIGTGREQERAVILAQALQIQQTIYSTYGPQNGLVTMTQIRNTLADMLALGGVRNSDRYFEPMNFEKEQMLQQQAAEAAMQQQAAMGQQADPAQMLMQTEGMKAQTRAQVDLARAQLDNQYKMHKLAMDDDLARDEMVQDLAVKVAEILGKYNTSVDVQNIKAEQNAPREHNEQMMGMSGGY